MPWGRLQNTYYRDNEFRGTNRHPVNSTQWTEYTLVLPLKPASYLVTADIILNCRNVRSQHEIVLNETVIEVSMVSNADDLVGYAPFSSTARLFVKMTSLTDIIKYRFRIIGGASGGEAGNYTCSLFAQKLAGAETP